MLSPFVTSALCVLRVFRVPISRRSLPSQRYRLFNRMRPIQGRAIFIHPLFSSVSNQAVLVTVYTLRWRIHTTGCASFGGCVIRSCVNTATLTTTITVQQRPRALRPLGWCKCRISFTSCQYVYYDIFYYRQLHTYVTCRRREPKDEVAARRKPSSWSSIMREC